MFPEDVIEITGQKRYREGRVNNRAVGIHYGQNLLEGFRCHGFGIVDRLLDRRDTVGFAIMQADGVELGGHRTVGFGCNRRHSYAIAMGNCRTADGRSSKESEHGEGGAKEQHCEYAECRQKTLFPDLKSHCLTQYLYAV